MEKVTLGTRVVRGKDQVIHEMCDAIRVLAAKYRDAGSLEGLASAYLELSISRPACCASRRICRAGPNLRYKRKSKSY